jgi:two-component system sensor histidine kinase TctE
MFRREQRSLFGEILDWMLTPLLLLWPVSLVLTWLVAQGIAGNPFDRALEHNVRALAQQVVLAPGGRVQFSLPQSAHEMLRADESDQVFYQVRGPTGAWLAGERELGLPNDTERPLPGEVRLRDDELRGLGLRVAYAWVALDASGQSALVQVAETREKRSMLAAEIIKGVMLPQFVILPLAVLLVWLALVRGIKPLSELEERIRARKPDDLSPLDDRTVPLEVAPLVSSVNDLLTRLKDSIATQKRFLADAAHQLKTPLAGLRMQADLAQREGANAEELKQSLQQIRRSSMRATHTVNQLLALARAENAGAQIARQPCDLARLVMDVVQDALPRAMDKGLDLGYDGAQPGSPGVQLDGNPTLLQELVRNLLDNAIAYTPSPGAQPGVVTARVLAAGPDGPLRLQVEDSGSGIPAAERELVFQPFYRALGTDADGSGLGLPIVREIAGHHNATVTLGDAHPGQQPPGTRVDVRFGRT